MAFDLLFIGLRYSFDPYLISCTHPFCSILNLVRSQPAVELQVAYTYHHRIVMGVYFMLITGE